MNGVECLLFDRNGKQPLAIEPQIEYVAWRLNRVGQAVLYLPYNDPACTKKNLALGNRVLIRFENGLPPFGGIIDEPRRRTATGVRVTVYTGERLLDWRRTAKTRAFDRIPPGMIVRYLLKEENAEYLTGVEAGSLYIGGAPRSETWHYTGLLDVLTNVSRLSGEDLAVVPVYEQGALSFELNWYARRGRDLSARVLLVEDQNILEPTLDEQGPIANRVLCAGSGAGGTTWDDRLIGEAVDVESRGLYGYREYTEVLTGVADQVTLDASAGALLDEMKAPRGQYKLTALNETPSGFGAYDVGDSVRVQAFLKGGEWAIDDVIRVVAREWTPDNQCRLEVV